MQSRSGASGAARILAVTACLAVASALIIGSSAAAADEPPSIEQPEPGPHEVVPAGSVTVTAQVHAAVEDAEVRLDGDQVTAEVADDEPATITAETSVEPGVREVTVTAETGEGTAERSWAVTVVDVEVARHAGADRIETAAAVSGTLHPEDGQADAALLARADEFADALVGAPLAASAGGPLLLTDGDALADAVADELSRTLGEEGTVRLLGGTAALDEAVADAVADLGYDVERHAGPEDTGRFGTAVDIAEAVGEADTALVASGEDFPDALAASAVAAAEEWPILLAPASGSLPAVVGDHLADRGYDALRRLGDRGDLAVSELSPAAGAQVDELDAITVTFDDAVDPEASAVVVEMAGHEVTAAAEDTDGERTLTVRPEVPRSLLGTPREVVVGIRGVSDAEEGLVHQRATLTWRAEPLSRGDTGRHVADLQEALRERRFWHEGAQGTLGFHTHHAVVAAQKTFGLPRDGTADGELGAALESEPLPEPRSTEGRTYEVDLARQTVALVEDGAVRWIFDASTGHGEPYQFEGEQYVATTTTGHHPVVWQYDGVREAARGELYRPKYYDALRGIAIHGYAEVPPEPASAGCIRVTNAAMDAIWSLDPGTDASVWVYPEDFYD